VTPAATPRWPAILFDLDGTLADTVPLILASFRHAMQTHRGASPPDEVWLAKLGRPLRDSFADLATDDAESQALQATYTAFQREAHDDMVRPLPGAVATVEALRGRGVPLAIVTSKRREMTLRTLDALEIRQHFATIVTPDEVQRGKPDPEPVRRALHELDLADRAEEVLFVGDSPYDVIAGRDAGVCTAALTWGTFSRDRLVAEAPDLVWSDLSPLTADV
jgi:pyrophosphatase PpaX